MRDPELRPHQAACQAVINPELTIRRWVTVGLSGYLRLVGVYATLTPLVPPGTAYYVGIIRCTIHNALQDAPSQRRGRLQP